MVAPIDGKGNNVNNYAGLFIKKPVPQQSQKVGNVPVSQSLPESKKVEANSLEAMGWQNMGLHIKPKTEIEELSTFVNKFSVASASKEDIAGAVAMVNEFDFHGANKEIINGYTRAYSEPPEVWARLENCLTDFENLV